MNTPEVKSLLAEAKAGGQAAFGQLYDMFASKIYKFIRFKVNTVEIAEDILQDVFLKAWQALPKLELERLNFSAWLYTVARNAVNDHHRRHYRTPQTVSLDERLDMPDKGAQARVIEQSEIEQVRRLSTQLPPNWRQVMELRFVQGFSVNEAARILGKSSMAVRLIQHRALKRLRELIIDDEYGVLFQNL